MPTNVRELFLSRVPLVSKTAQQIRFPTRYLRSNKINFSGTGHAYSAAELMADFTYLDGSPICSKESNGTQ